MLFTDDVVMRSRGLPEGRRWNWSWKNGEDKWKSEDWKLVEKRLNTWTARRRDPFTGRDNKESEHVQISDRRWRRRENWIQIENHDVTSRVQGGWNNSKRVVSYVWQDNYDQWELYRQWTLTSKKAQQKNLEVTERRKLRWLCGVNKVDMIRN